MEKYDIVVVGGGPAGCSFLDNLDADYEVLLVDKNSSPSYKVCGGLLTNDSMRYFDERRLEIPSDVFSYPKVLKKEYVDLDNGKEKLDGIVHNIDRKKFNEWMFNRVKGKADVLPHTSLEKIKKEDNKLRLALKDRKNDEIINVITNYVVGADGVYSKVRKEMNGPQLTKYISVQDVGEVNGENIDRFILYFSSEITDYYAWVIPKGNEIKIGLAYPTEFTNKVDEVRKITENRTGKKIKVKKREGYSIARPLSLDELYLGNENVLLVGEAAGWISPSSGDGMSFALRSGRNAARAFNNSEENVLDSYKENSKELLETFERKLEKSKIISSPELRRKLF